MINPVSAAPSRRCVMTHSYILCVCAYVCVHVSKRVCEGGDVLKEVNDKACLARSFVQVCHNLPMCVVCHDPFMCVTWLVDGCLGRSSIEVCVCHDSRTCIMFHDSFMCVTWFVDVCPSRSSIEVCVCNDSLICVMFHDSFMCVTWLVDACLGYSFVEVCVCHDSCTCATWLIRVCNVTYSCVCHDVFICVVCSFVEVCVCLLWLIHIFIPWLTYVHHVCVHTRVRLCASVSWRGGRCMCHLTNEVNEWVTSHMCQIDDSYHVRQMNASRHTPGR